MKPKFRQSVIALNHPREASPLKIVGDGAIATGSIGEGRLIPLVILDATARPDIAEYIRIHEHIGVGDVKVQWGQLPGRKNTVVLYLTFTRPADVTAIVEFELDRNHGVLVEQILTSGGLYIQAGKEGDRLKHDLNRPKVILEVPDLGFGPMWASIYRQHLVQKFRKHGQKKAEADANAEAMIKAMREVNQLRFPPPQRDNAP